MIVKISKKASFTLIISDFKHLISFWNRQCVYGNIEKHLGKDNKDYEIQDKFEKEKSIKTDEIKHYKSSEQVKTNIFLTWTGISWCS